MNNDDMNIKLYQVDILMERVEKLEGKLERWFAKVSEDQKAWFERIFEKLEKSYVSKEEFKPVKEKVWRSIKFIIWLLLLVWTTVIYALLSSIWLK